jgi:hypothetical protein
MKAWNDEFKIDEHATDTPEEYVKQIILPFEF